MKNRLKRLEKIGNIKLNTPMIIEKIEDNLYKLIDKEIYFTDEEVQKKFKDKHIIVFDVEDEEY